MAKSSTTEELQKTAKQTNHDLRKITNKAMDEIKERAEMQRQRARDVVSRNPTKSVAFALATGFIIGSAVTMAVSRAKT